MARDIEEFLRRAAERRRQQKGGAPQQPPKQPSKPAQRQRPLEPQIIEDVEIVPTPPPASARRPSQQPVQRPPQQRPPQRLPSEQPRRDLRNESISEHVKSHIDTSRIADHAEHLGERITKVHEKVESRIQKRLDHDITVIDDTPSVTAKPPVEIFGARSTASADGLREMLQDPKSIGQAILLAEILKRPDFD